MLKKMLLTVVLLIPAACAQRVGFGAYYGPPPPVRAYGPPPPVPSYAYGYRPPCPGPNFVWINGFWDYGPRGGGYAWRQGYWAQRPHRGAAWVAPRWNRGHYYGGYWRR